MVSERAATEEEVNNRLGKQDAPAVRSIDTAALDTLLLLLKILGQRTILLAGHAFPLVALTIGFYLWLRVMDSPTPYQLAGLALYGLFALAMQVLRRK